MTKNKLILSLTTGLCIAFSSAAGHAAGSTDAEKLDFIKQQFQQHKGYSQLWNYGWLGVFAGSAAVNGALWSESSSRPEKFKSKVGFITSSLGVGSMLIDGVPTHRYAAKMKQGNVELAQAEAWLAKAAEKEQYQRSWVNHFLSGAVAVASGIAIAKNDHHKTSDGVATFATNFIASQAKIWTTPTDMTKAWNAYQSNNLESVSLNNNGKTEPNWQFAAAGPVLHIQYQF